VTSLLIGMLAEPSVAVMLRGPLQAAGLSSSGSDTAALVLGVALSTIVLMVAGELVPKNWAISRPLAVAKVAAGPLYFFSAALSPLIGHLNSVANRFVRRLGLQPVEHLAGARTPQELVALARHSARAGALAPDTADRFIRSLRLSELTTENVMTPRVDIRALEVHATAADVAELTRATGLSRFPVYRGDLDEIVGVVNIRDVLTVPADERAARRITSVMTAPMRVPESLTAEHLLDQLGGEDTLVVVVDEYGGTAGIATLEDIIEEVVGDVDDEHDPSGMSRLVELAAHGDGQRRWEADGMVRLDELEGLGMSDIEGPYETLAGLISHRLGRIPDIDDRVDVSGWTLEVQTVAHHVAERVRITSPERSHDDAAGSDIGEPR
jgi:CBS domain containing-hemolysin-like protein